MSPAPAPAVPAAAASPNPAATRAVIGFVVRFVLGWAAAIVIVSWVPALDRWAVGHTVKSLGGMARLLGLAFSASGGSIQLAGASMQIVPDCTPMMPVAALAIAVFAFPAPWRWRALGLAGGVVVLWLYNLLRIWALAVVLRSHPSWFEFIHIYLWQTMTLLVVFAIFVAWLWLQGRPGRRTGEGSASPPDSHGGAPAGPAAAGAARGGAAG